LSLAQQHVPGVLRHLRRLTESFVHEGQRIAYIHVYARPLAPGREPPLEFLTAQESGFEGIACVDDAARAALLALHTHALLAAQPQEQERATVALGLAHDWLRFVTYMQEPDGCFLNFIADAAGTKNRQGRTSYAGGPWWTARALWALATAWRATGDERYGLHVLRGRLTPTRDLKVTALQALALMELYQRRPEPRLRQRICALCDTLVASGPGYFRDHRGRSEVALWGYHQVQAVAQAARLFARLDYVRACQETVHNLIAPVVAGGFYHVYPHQRDGQCAYSVSTLVLGLEELYRVSGRSPDLDLALECADWLAGHNAAGTVLYDPETGCCSDGIAGGRASSNCGAESAIEAGFVELARRRLQRGAQARPAVHAALGGGQDRCNRRID
jgi:hypothetical protein